ncbi:MAG: pyridoxamine 5'-phosphate oxidase family protein, partial [Proteobacteria bacterium]|nr:pyridoxamine 5'-phosphate oxidase family protein [Pseudomonadota bacterium]
MTAAIEARALIRSTGHGALATLMSDAGPGGACDLVAPYASLVEIACDATGAPLLLLSDLAQHTQNLKSNSKASLLIDGTGGSETRLDGARLSLTGHVVRDEAPRHHARYLARHPSASRYAALGDFHFYRFVIQRAHLVGGFGHIVWLDADEALLSEDRAQALAE